MKKIFAITKKEIIDNFRDKRAFYTALLYPIGFPLYLALVFYMSASLFNVSFDKEADLHVVGADHAPNLVQFLEQNNFKIVAAPNDYVKSIENLDLKAVLVIDESFGERLREGLPAPLKVFMSESDTASTKEYRKISTVLNRYGNSINQRRLQVRGIDVNLFDSIDVQKEDVSKEGASGRAQGMMIPLSLIISMLMGGFYLAIEVTAGEKEKHTLEPLLTLPISRWTAVIGKFLALLVFCLLSLFLGVVGCALIFGIVPIEKLPANLTFNLEVFSKILLILIPLAVMLASLLMVVSSFTKSTKEAQAYLGGTMFLFLGPSFYMMFKTFPISKAVFATPIVGHYKLLDMVFKDESIAFTDYAVSLCSTLAVSVALLYLAHYLYKQDRILAT